MVLLALVPAILISGCIQNTFTEKNTTATDNDSIKLNDDSIYLNDESIKLNNDSIKLNNDSIKPNTASYIKKAPVKLHCEPLKDKNKVAVVFAKNGIYDTETAHSYILKYYDSVKSDLNLDNAGLQKFDGETMDGFEAFIDSLYLNDDVGYIVLLGDGLPVANFPIELAKDGFVPSGVTYDYANLYAISEKLEYVNKSDRECTPQGECVENCKDLAISLIMPPDLYSDEEKAAFTLKILETYADYHNNFAARIAEYQDSALVIYDSTIYTDDRSSGYDIPMRIVNNQDAARIASELKSKHKVVVLRVHGSADSVGMGIGNFGTTEQEYLNFAKENGLPFLFVDSTACQSFALKMENATHCCWPQIFLESGVWAYYLIYPESNEVKKNFPHGETLGMALRKYPAKQSFIFGDILAHMKGNSSVNR